MIVRAIATTGGVLPAFSRNKAVGIDADTEFAVTTGRTYLVFAVTIYLGVAWYYIFDDDGHSWPTWVPAPLFELVDGHIPASWKIGYYNFGREKQYPILSFPEWADDHSFYERLVDGDENATRIFDERRREIE